jgi:hypothetical protein
LLLVDFPFLPPDLNSINPTPPEWDRVGWFCYRSLILYYFCCIYRIENFQLLLIV